MRAWRVAACGVAVLLALSVPSPVRGADETRIVEGEHLRIVSALDRDAAADLVPGETIDWVVDIDATGAEPGEITASLERSGELAVDAAVHGCDVAWRGSDCVSGARQLRPLSRIPGGGVRDELTRSISSEVVHLRIVVAAPETMRQGEQANVRVVAAGFGEEIEIGGTEGELPATGGEGPWPITLGALGALAVGGVLAAARHRRSAER